MYEARTVSHLSGSDEGVNHALRGDSCIVEPLCAAEQALGRVRAIEEPNDVACLRISCFLAASWPARTLKSFDISLWDGLGCDE